MPQEKSRKVIDRHREAFVMGLQKGVGFAAGPDAGSPVGVSHPSLLDELKSMVDYGCKPVTALRSATVFAAKALGMERAIGLNRGREES